VYSIGAVAKMLGIDAATLRAWEDRYGMVVPERSEGGQRVYSREDLERLRFVRQAMDEGSSAADSHRLLAEELRIGSSVGPRPTGPTMVVLIAERDRYAAEFTEYLLRTEGYDVCLALDPAGAERLLQDRQPVLVIVEVMMAGGGLDLCRRLASGGSPVLATSALDVAEGALAAGASAFLSKPIEPLMFVSTVRDLLGQSALTRSLGADAR
jgi:DNA-binding transcriptional MerR regulator